MLGAQASRLPSGEDDLSPSMQARRLRSQALANSSPLYM